MYFSISHHFKIELLTVLYRNNSKQTVVNHTQDALSLIYSLRLFMSNTEPINFLEYTCILQSKEDVINPYCEMNLQDVEFRNMCRLKHVLKVHTL